MHGLGTTKNSAMFFRDNSPGHCNIGSFVIIENGQNRNLSISMHCKHLRYVSKLANSKETQG